MYGRNIFERLGSQEPTNIRSTDWFVSHDQGLGALLPLSCFDDDIFFIDVFKITLKKDTT